MLTQSMSEGTDLTIFVVVVALIHEPIMNTYDKLQQPQHINPYHDVNGACQRARNLCG